MKILTLLTCLLMSASIHAGGKLKVFLLVGQSNMQGKGSGEHIPALIADPKKSKDFNHLMKNGKHVVRKDVWVWYLDKKGDLSAGFGSGKGDKSFGPELGFGHVIGNHYDEQILLIKCAWGGKSLGKDFLPPGSGGPGEYYTLTIKHTKDVLANIKKHFPAYDGNGYELCGMVWFQGWNDLVGKGNPDYEKQLAQFIRDVRKELQVPDLPVVIGESGQGGELSGKNKDSGKQLIRDAQKAVAEMPEFKETVSFVQTSQFHIPELGEMADVFSTCKRAIYLEEMKRLKALGYKSKKALKDLPAEKRREVNKEYKLSKEQKEKFMAPWKKIQPEWQKVGGDGGYHFYGSGEIFYRMGDAFGKAMVETMGSTK